MKEKNYTGIMRKYYYERYESLQYQLMIISGGTLTVFVSINKSVPVIYLYKFGFILLGISLIFGSLSIFFFQLHLFLYTEIKNIDNQIQVSKLNNKQTQGLNFVKRFINKEYLIAGNFIFGIFQFLLFLSGLTLIILGLIES